MAQDDAIAISNGLIIQTPISESNNTNKKKRNLPGNPDPEAEVISLSPKTLLATNRFLCEICGKGFQRDQNLQLHRRGHNLPWKLKQRNGKELRKRVYVCPETTCVHHNPLRALGDLTGIKKHFCRKHGEKKWKCEKCNKNYAVKSDWKAHSKTCGTREYKCDCGTIFSRRDSFITHRAFCDALAEEAARLNAASHFSLGEAVASNGNLSYNFIAPQQQQELFKSLLPSKESHEIITSNNIEELEAQKGYVPLWMRQMSQQGAHLHTDPTTMSDNNVIQQLRAGSIHGSLVSQQHLNWAIGNTNKMWSNSSQEQMASTSVPMMSASTSNTRQELVGSVHSLYSNHHQTPSLALAHMSATALLQKAAQFGAISNDPLQVLGNLRESDINEIQDHHQVSKYCSGSVGDLAGYGSNSTTTNLVGTDVESTTNEFSPMNSNTQMETNPLQLKRRRLMEDDHHGDDGQTRDFLGVGGAESICNPCSTNGWI